MSVQTVTTNSATAFDCPPGCIANHLDGDLHLQQDVTITDDYGRLQGVSGYISDDRTRKGVYVGSYEFNPAHARQVAAAILAALDFLDEAAR